MALEQQHLFEMCRLCLKKSELKYSLLASNIIKKVQSLASVEIKEDDNLPTSCCKTCVTNIDSCYKFKEQILQSDKILRELHFKIESVPNVLKLAKESPELFEVLRVGEDNNIISITKPKVESVEIFDEDVLDDSYLKREPIDDADLKINPPNIDVQQESMLTLSENSSDENNADQFTFVVKKPNAALTCEICNRHFPTKRSFQRHMQGHKLETCSVCDVVIRTDNLKKHLEMHESSQEVCDVCGKIAKNRESLRGHMYYSHREIDKQIKCEYCCKDFKHNNHYLAHVRSVHLLIRNSQCHLCGKKFSNGYSLRKHINMTHHGSRPDVCKYCSKGFSSPYALKTHLRQHTLETPYPCAICHQGFRQKVSLVTHLKSKHSVAYTKVEAASVKQMEQVT